jgi:hypothetical protein
LYLALIFARIFLEGARHQIRKEDVYGPLGCFVLDRTNRNWCIPCGLGSIVLGYKQITQQIVTLMNASPGTLNYFMRVKIQHKNSLVDTV